MIKTAWGAPIEFVAKIEVENWKGKKIGTVKAGLIITDEKEHRGVGIKNACLAGALAGIQKNRFLYKQNNCKVLYIREESIQKILDDPKFKSLAEKYYGVKN